MKSKKLNVKLTKPQSGFTLIEIAIVLVIIGLLLGGVLQGQQLIENSRVKAAVNDFNGISAAAFSYQDRYGRLPGDDAAGDGSADTDIQARGASWATVTAGNENGVIGSALTTTFTADVDASDEETNDFFQHMRAAGFIAGDPSEAGLQALPQNSFGGLIGITTADVGLPAGTPLTGTKICMGNVGGSAAIAIDTQLDDGNSSAGRVRAFVGGANTPPTATDAAAYSEDSTYTLCYRI